MVKNPLQGTWIGSLLGELRSHILDSVPQKERPIKTLEKKKKVEVEEMQVYLGVRFEIWIRVTLTFSLQPYTRLAILQ